MLGYLNYYLFRWLGFRVVQVYNGDEAQIGMGLIFVTRDSGWDEVPFEHWRNPIFLIYGASAEGADVNKCSHEGRID